MDGITTPQQRQAQSSEGLRQRLFDTLDAVIEGKIEKEQVEAVCHLSQEILKSARVDLEFEEKAMEKLKLNHKIEQERQNSLALLSATIEDVVEVHTDE